MALSKEIKDYYKSFAQHGTGNTLVMLTPQEVVLLLGIAYFDVNGLPLEGCPTNIITLIKKPYFSISDYDISKLDEMIMEDAISYFQKADAFSVSEFTLYFKKLCELHRKRVKYRRILQNQPFPSVEQIGPRSLLEYGNCDPILLFNWMSWRKWSYDIDNRSAQETGYLFEPILVSCIGGESLSHSKSPVKRINNEGHQSNEGRQIDCYLEKENKKYAYELKMRVTIAASGQGRFKEEMTFPIEAHKAGIIPVLIVFDQTDSTLLDKLKQSYLDNNGEVYIGDDAWVHLKKDAGDSMGLFIEKFVEPPITKMEEHLSAYPKTIQLESTDDFIIISDSNSNKYEIPRNL